MAEGSIMCGLPGELGLLYGVYIRKAYIEIMSLITERIPYLMEIKRQADFPIVITGTPGMGKSYFLGVCLAGVNKTEIYSCCRSVW